MANKRVICQSLNNVTFKNNNAVESGGGLSHYVQILKRRIGIGSQYHHHESDK